MTLISFYTLFFLLCAFLYLLVNLKKFTYPIQFNCIRVVSKYDDLVYLHDLEGMSGETVQ